MNHSPLAYPLTRGIDGDSGGAADLQTDVMRFMAILGLCLVAIFALVQSLPMEAAQGIETSPEPQPELESEPEPASEPEREKSIVLTRPAQVTTIKPAAPTPVPAPVPAPEPSKEGFTLRFASDLALTRLVATGQVGFYAMDAGRAQRMMVSDSRISFWDASTPNTFHEMDAGTVPRAVMDALKRSGVDASGVNWGVTLPGKLRVQLDALMQQHTGGALVIRTDGSLTLESG
jgi:hypothetical protein